MDMVLLGPPGVGKGTQAGTVARWFGLVHLAAGDVLRRNVREGTRLGQRACGYMERGELVPDDLVADVILAETLKCPGVLLDGFPRTVPQAHGLNEGLAGHGRGVDAVVLLSAPRDTLVGRLAGRLTCRDCNASFHRLARPPRRAGWCDECGGELRVRPDDAASTVRRRLEIYQRQTAPLISYYTRRGVLIEVDADAAPETVTSRMAVAFTDRGLRPAVADRR